MKNTDEKAWLQEKMEECDLLIKDMTLAVQNINRLKGGIGAKKLNPGRLGKLSDMGKERKAVILQNKAIKSMDTFLRGLGIHPAFSDFSQYRLDKTKEAVSTKDFLSRPKTQLAIKKQSLDLLRGLQHIKFIRRKMSSILLRMDKKEEELAILDKLDEIEKQIRDQLA